MESLSKWTMYAICAISVGGLLTCAPRWIRALHYYREASPGVIGRIYTLTSIAPSKSFYLYFPFVFLGLLVAAAQRTISRNEPFPTLEIAATGLFIIYLASKILLPPLGIVLATSTNNSRLLLSRLNTMSRRGKRVLGLLRFPKTIDEHMNPVFAPDFYWNNLRLAENKPWRPAVFYLIETVPLIFFDLRENSEWLAEELRHVVERRRFEHTYFLVLPGSEQVKELIAAGGRPDCIFDDQEALLEHLRTYPPAATR